MSPSAMPRAAASCGMDAHRLAAVDLRREAGRAEIELAVQPGRRLVGDQLQRKARGGGESAPSTGGSQVGMAGAIGIAETGDRLRGDLDPAARRRQRRGLGVAAEARGRCRHPRAAVGKTKLAVLPRTRRRSGALTPRSASGPAGRLVEMFEPLPRPSGPR